LNRSYIVAGVAGVLIGGSAVALATGGLGGGTQPGRAEVERIVRAYILEHPEIIPAAIQKLQDRDMAKAVEANRAAYETPFGSAWAGAEKGDVVLVEFFDYACGFCRKSNADIERLLKEDSKLKVVWRELPVLGPDSRTAAEASLAAAQAGRFREFYGKMFALGRPGPDTITQAARTVGVSPAPSPAFRAEIEKNYELARAVNASGTPTFVVGEKVLQGAVGYEALKEAIAAARASS
jgi:protein-disulfide isomerase